jgi:hypothetical protein
VKHLQKLAPVGALMAALISISCCVPLGFTAALGLAGVSVFAGKHQGWLIGASIVLLLLGTVQVVRKPVCQRRSRTNRVLLCLAGALVVSVVLFPQLIASLFADHFR